MKTINKLKLTYQKNLLLGLLCSVSIALLLSYLLVTSESVNRVKIYINRPQPKIIRVNMDKDYLFAEIEPENIPKSKQINKTTEIPEGRINKIKPISDDLILGNIRHIQRLGFDMASFHLHNEIQQIGINLLLNETESDKKKRKKAELQEICGIDYLFDFTKIPEGLTRLERIDWRKNNRSLMLIDFPHLSNEIPYGNEAIVIVSCIVNDSGFIVNSKNGFKVIMETSPQYFLSSSLIDKLIKVSDDGNIRPPLIDGKPVYSLFTFFWEINNKGVSKFDVKHTAELKYK